MAGKRKASDDAPGSSPPPPPRRGAGNDEGSLRDYSVGSGNDEDDSSSSRSDYSGGAGNDDDSLSDYSGGAGNDDGPSFSRSDYNRGESGGGLEKSERLLKDARILASLKYLPVTQVPAWWPSNWRELTAEEAQAHPPQPDDQYAEEEEAHSPPPDDQYAEEEAQEHSPPPDDQYAEEEAQAHSPPPDDQHAEEEAQPNSPPPDDQHAKEEVQQPPRVDHHAAAEVADQFVPAAAAPAPKRVVPAAEPVWCLGCENELPSVNLWPVKHACLCLSCRRILFGKPYCEVCDGPRR